MQPVYSNARFHIKKVLPERNVIFKYKILVKFLRLENESFLEKENNNGEEYNASEDVPDEGWQEGWFEAKILGIGLTG
jgi:hypothetical protein